MSFANRRSIIWMLLFLVGAAPTVAQDRAADFEALARYETGDDSDPLERIDEAVVRSYDDPDGRRTLESALLGILSSGNSTTAAKTFSAKQLYRIASAASVGKLEVLLRNADTTHLARYALERIPDPSATEALVRALRNTRGLTRVGIINSLGERRDASAVSALRGLSGNGDRNVMRAAIVAMGKIGGEEAAAGTRWCSENIRFDLRAVATEAYLRCADSFLDGGDLRTAGAMYDRVYIPAEMLPLRMAALRGLIQAEPERAAALIIDVLQHDEPGLQEVAASSIADISDEGINRIADAMGTLSPEIQVIVLETLARRPVASGLETTIAASRHSDERVRAAAVTALGAYPDPSTIESLLRLAASSSGVVQEAARNSLIRIDAPGANYRIARAAMSRDNGLRAEALRIISARGASEAIPILKRTCERDVEALRMLALDGLAEAATVEELPFLVAHLEKATSDQERSKTRSAIVATARRAEPGEARVRPILRAMGGGTRSIESDVALLTLLGEIGDDAALPEFRSAATRRNTEVREVAIRILGRWNSPAPLDILDRVIRNPKNETEQRVALNGYLRLLRLPHERELPDTIARYERLTNQTLSTAQKKQLLAGLSELNDPAAVSLITPFVADPDVSEEAVLALEKANTQ